MKDYTAAKDMADLAFTFVERVEAILDQPRVGGAYDRAYWRIVEEFDRMNEEADRIMDEWNGEAA